MFIGILLLLSSTILALLAAEIVVRVIDVPPKPLESLPIPTYRLSEDPALGYEYRPNYKPTDMPYDSSHNGFAINSAGFRDFEYSIDKPPDTCRIIVLGDSTTAGNGVSELNNIYTKRLEQLLNKYCKGGKRFEVLNMGVGGYNTMQEVETLKVKGLKYEPDIVLVTLCLNDFDLNADGGVYRALSSKNCILPKDAGLNSLNAVLRVSRLAFIIYHRLNFKLAKDWYSDWYSKTILNGKTPVHAGLTLLSDLQQKNGFSAIVMILPDFSTSFNKYRCMDLHKKVFKAAEGLPGITIVDLLKSFANVDNDLRNFSYDGCHMNENGHEVMAKIIFDILKNKQFVSCKSEESGTFPKGTK